MACLSNKDVRWLDVAMDNSAGVSSIESIGDFNGQWEQNLHPQRASANAMLESCALQKLHRDERVVLVFPGLMTADFIDGADVGMVQCGGGTGFPPEAIQGLRILRNVVRKEF